MADDLIQWLKAQVQADYVVARDALADWVDSEDGDEMASQTESILVGAHLVWWNPKRVIAECAVKQRIIRVHAVRSNTGGDWDTDPPAICNEDNDLHPCDTLRLLTLPYCDREGYRTEWGL